MAKTNVIINKPAQELADKFGVNRFETLFHNGRIIKAKRKLKNFNADFSAPSTEIQTSGLQLSEVGGKTNIVGDGTTVKGLTTVYTPINEYTDPVISLEGSSYAPPSNPKKGGGFVNPLGDEPAGTRKEQNDPIPIDKGVSDLAPKDEDDKKDNNNNNNGGGGNEGGGGGGNRGGGNNGNQNTDNNEESQKSNTFYYIAGGVFLLVLLIFFAFKKRK